MADKAFSVDGYVKSLETNLGEIIEKSVPGESLSAVLDKLPAMTDHIVWKLSRFNPDEGQKLALEIRRKVGLAVMVWPVRDCSALLDSLRDLLCDMEDFVRKKKEPENN